MMKKERDHTIEGEEVDADECTTAGSTYANDKKRETFKTW